MRQLRRSRLVVACTATWCAFSCVARQAEPPKHDAPEGRTRAVEPEPEQGERELNLGDGIFLSVLPLRVSTAAKRLVASQESDEAFARQLSVRLQVLPAYDDLGELSRRSKRKVKQGNFELQDLTQLGSNDKPKKREKLDSFIIDYEEPSFEKPVAALERRGEVTPEAVEAFVSDYIDDKTYTRGFDIASRVASTRSGDCTEHAVLTAALLRHFGFHARLLFGIVLVGIVGPELPPEMLAAGHAWVEVYEDDGWRIVDSALYVPRSETATTSAKTVGVPGLPEGAKVRRAYLPINLLEDESVGYSRALMDEVGVDAITGLDVDVEEEGED